LGFLRQPKLRGLAGIAAGTVLNLSFDLIGFGRGADASNSQARVA
jgi:hypothetical protein